MERGLVSCWSPRPQHAKPDERFSDSSSIPKQHHHHLATIRLDLLAFLALWPMCSSSNKLSNGPVLRVRGVVLTWSWHCLAPMAKWPSVWPLSLPIHLERILVFVGWTDTAIL